MKQVLMIALLVISTSAIGDSEYDGGVSNDAAVSASASCREACESTYQRRLEDYQRDYSPDHPTTTSDAERASEILNQNQDERNTCTSSCDSGS